jgi:hypothetical protein
MKILSNRSLELSEVEVEVVNWLIHHGQANWDNSREETPFDDALAAACAASEVSTTDLDPRFKVWAAAAYAGDDSPEIGDL